MNNEIKEILDYYKKDNEEFEEFMIKNFNQHQLETTFHDRYQRYKNHKVLLDYITNLQEEYKQANYDRYMNYELFVKEKEENEILKKDVEALKKQYNELFNNILQGSDEE